jgi:hypothetical protein
MLVSYKEPLFILLKPFHLPSPLVSRERTLRLYTRSTPNTHEKLTIIHQKQAGDYSLILTLPVDVALRK